jgi:hypothetical protein
MYIRSHLFSSPRHLGILANHGIRPGDVGLARPAAPRTGVFHTAGINGHISDDRSPPPTAPGVPPTLCAFVCRPTSAPFPVMPPAYSI